MLPALPTPPPVSPAAAAPSGSRQGLRARLAALLSEALCLLLPLPGRRRLLAPLLVLLLVLQGCNSASQPPRAVLLDALALQIRLTQDQVAQALRLEPAGLPEVSRVRVEAQQPLRIGDQAGLRLTGRFDWRLASDPIRVDSPFELYLQRGERGQSWRLARPAGSADGSLQDWITEPLPLPGQRPSRAAAAASGSGGAG